MSFAEGEPGTGRQPTEEELRAAYEEEIRQIRVEQVLLEHVVTLVNLGMRRTGLAPGTEGERDAAQVGLAVEGVRALLPLIEQIAPEQIGPIRDALSQLQMAYVRLGGQEGATAPAPPPPPPGSASASAASPSSPPASEVPPAPEPAPGADPPTAGEPDPEGPGPAQRSGRLWIPGS